MNQVGLLKIYTGAQAASPDDPPTGEPLWVWPIGDGDNGAGRQAANFQEVVESVQALDSLGGPRAETGTF